MSIEETSSLCCVAPCLKQVSAQEAQSQARTHHDDTHQSGDTCRWQSI